jgi:hypothetical protein
MLKVIRTASYFIGFLVVCGLFVWQAIVGSRPPLNTLVYRDQLKITAANVFTTANFDADDADDALRIYAVNIILTSPFMKPFIAYGIYLGQGKILTAAHLVGHWPFRKLRVLIAGKDLPANVIEEGSFSGTDLALLSVDQEQLPISLRLLRNPLCKEPSQVGMDVIILYPERTVRSQIVSPLLVSPDLQMKFRSLISDVQGSGAGVFNAKQKCLLGIFSREVEKNVMQTERKPSQSDRYVGYFVPLLQVLSFLSNESRN